MNKCLNCKSDISNKATYCSDKCRMAYQRRTKKGAQPEHLEPEQSTRTMKTNTDQLFEDSRPGYYTFGEEPLAGACVLCGKEFKTHLSLLRFCSPNCQRQAMVVVANGPHKNYKEAKHV